MKEAVREAPVIRQGHRKGQVLDGERGVNMSIETRKGGGAPERARDEAKQAFAKTTANELALVPVPGPWREGKG